MGLVIRLHTRPVSLSGVKIGGENLVRFVYLDESGISIHERFTVVAGVVIHADFQWKAVESHIEELINEYVPIEHRKGFVFHAKDLFHGAGTVFDRRKFPLERAHDALEKLVSTPSYHRLPIVYGWERKYNQGGDTTIPINATKRIRREDASKRHAYVFSLCAIQTEEFMKRKTPYGEVAQLVAELNINRFIPKYSPPR